ncbi:hypothetical protein [Empedobacter sp. GD03797]|uniref:hypothetical protein n=1 Tax=Empedobacter sp. GD03797 TaxID=2975382 RepID=UPI00244A8D0C|nr:hypothetical protein [Empedobacter sp. GD03797]MDH1884204.1 hypothetical protein [Empedobacter sp. GD03797]
MVKELLANFEKEIDSSIQVEESEKEVVYSSIKLDMLSGAKGALELLSKNDQFIDESSNVNLETIGQLISDINDEIEMIVQSM